MIQVAAARASLPPPLVGLTLPRDEAVEAATEAHLAAKSAHLVDPSAETAAAKNDTAVELRYRRWVYRGGPAAEQEYQDARAAALAAGDDPAFWPEHSSKQNAALYQRWLAEREV